MLLSRLQQQSHLANSMHSQNSHANSLARYCQHSKYSRHVAHATMRQRLPHQQQFALLLIAFILLQHADVFMCRHVMAASKRLAASSSSSGAANKRTLIAAGSGSSGGSGQPEEIFNVGDQMEANYDEYPMVVPKRAALLLDRLMVALHHALEEERRKISDFYVNKSGGFKEKSDAVNKSTQVGLDAAAAADDDDELEQANNANNMYSDDDPTVIMDYDFKDLNSINRATGETLMGKSFQRRANLGLELGGDIGTEGVALLTAAAAAAADSSGGGVVGGDGRLSGRRLYWRCYFNAVSCF